MNTILATCYFVLQVMWHCILFSTAKENHLVTQDTTGTVSLYIKLHYITITFKKDKKKYRSHTQISTFFFFFLYVSKCIKSRTQYSKITLFSVSLRYPLWMYAS